MQYQVSNFKIFIEDDYDSMSKTAAEIYAGAIKASPNGNFGFATGGTPVGLYKELIAKVNAGALSFAGITSFNLDEYFPITRANDQSYFYFMQENLFKHVDIDQSKINVPNGEAADAATECAAYEKKLADAGYVEVQLLGIGLDGHIGFNEPTDHFPSATHYTELDKSTIEANARFFKSIDDVPTKAVTMGIKSIMMAKEILLVANGANKAHIIKEMLFGNITPEVPASALQMHRNVSIVLDKAAAAEIMQFLK